MSAGFSIGGLCVNVFALLCLAVGGYVFLRSMFPRRRGETPHCRKCGYNLTGNASGECPECGVSLSGRKAIVHGVRSRSRLGIVMGLLAMLIGLAPIGVAVAWRLSQVDWMQWAPTGIILGELSASTPGTSQRALAELDRRYAAGWLSSAQISDFIDECLQEQAAPTMRPGVDAGALAALGRFIADGRLSEEQMQRYLANRVRVTIRTRDAWVPRLGAVVHVSFDARAAERLVGIRPGEVRLDGVVVEPGGEAYTGYEFGGRSGSGATFIRIRPFQCEEFGDAVLDVDVKVACHNRLSGDTVDDDFTTMTPRDTVRVTAKAEDVLRFVRNSEMDQNGRRAVSIGALRLCSRSAGLGGGSQLELPLTYQTNVPCAFGVYVLNGADAIRLGELLIDPGLRFQGRVSTALNLVNPPQLPDVVGVLLIPEWIVAYGGVSTEFWGGALLFESVEVRRNDENCGIVGEEFSTWNPVIEDPQRWPSLDHRQPPE